MDQHKNANIAQLKEALELSYEEVEECLGQLEKEGLVERLSDGFLRSRKMPQS